MILKFPIRHSTIHKEIYIYIIESWMFFGSKLYPIILRVRLLGLIIVDIISEI